MEAVTRVSEFVELFTQSARRIYGYIRTLVPNQSDAEDCFQETSKVLWEKFGEYQTGTDFCSWALSIAHFKALQARRRHSTSRLVLSDDLEQLLVNAAVQAQNQTDVRFRALADCFQKLPEVDRDLIDARYRPGTSTKAIAEEWRRSTDAIYRSLRRIHKALFDCVHKAIEEEAVS